MMIFIDKLSPKPVFEQLVDGIERGILIGVYPPGEPIPSVREMATTLGINPNTIQKSYAELIRRGVISPSPGNGSYVAHDAAERIHERALKRLGEVRGLAAELKLAGITEDDIVRAVHEVYASDKKPSDKTNSKNEDGSEDKK